ncbi:MAG: hypothetical protein DRH08_09245 [Deltaproteobacteria bacterium]|nr:MAG: hypothetical protein DRH08_09245 [Deltaproteobacteria bacterium]
MAILSKAIIKGATLFFVKLDPKRPALNYNEDGYEWQLQVRTTDKKAAKRWKEEFHLNMKFDQEDTKTGDTYHGARLSRRAYTIEGGKDTMFEPPGCMKVEGQLAIPLDANTIGNNSVADVMIQLRSYKFKKKEGVTADLLGILVRDLKEYTQVADPDWDLEGGDTVVTDAAVAPEVDSDPHDESAY